MKRGKLAVLKGEYWLQEKVLLNQIPRELNCYFHLLSVPVKFAEDAGLGGVINIKDIWDLKDN